MKIYLVCWADCASDNAPYYVEKVFLSEQAAKDFIDGLHLYPSGSDCVGIYGEPWITEMEAE